MKTTVASVLSLAVLMLAVHAADCPASRPVHMEYPVKLMNLETGYVLGGGQPVKIGIGDSGFGIGGLLQISTNTLMDAVTLLNGQLKVRLLPESFGIASVSAGVAYYDLVSSRLIIDTIVEEVFTGEDVETDSNLDILYFFVSASRRVGPLVRFHAGYQERRLSGELATKGPVDLESDGESMGIEFEFEETATHRCILFGADLDLLEHLKFMLELGYDISYGRSRGGAGVRAALGGSFALQAGVLWPGISLDEDLDIPVLPHLSVFWRF